ncbi:hypothetical protein D6821_00015 [Candidatus Parcubacteria bacterium]|nr:MAG: hypothetical protein D6821_00015 [Candidatus Parcubacteria bacterium]
MTPERWQTIKGHIKDNLTLLDEGQDFYEDEGGVEIEFIEFEGPMGKMRLEFVAKPVVLDKKTIYSRRIGSETAVEYVYSEDEKTYKLLAYKWDSSNEKWTEIDASAFA